MALPRSQTEEAIAAIWRQVLRSTSVDCAEDFFRIGGHSLLATQVASRIRDVFQVELPVALLFQHRTVQSLATSRRQSVAGQAARRAHAADRAAGLRRLPNVFRCRRSACGSSMSSPLTTRPTTFPLHWQLRGELDIDAMEQAIDALHLRHEALRTTYLLDGPYPVQIVQPWT